MKKILVNLFLLLFLGTHLATMIRGVEDYPLTAAIMFARDVDDARPRYTFHWIVTDESGQQEVLPQTLDLHPRHFFLEIYRPDDPSTPYIHARGADTEEAFRTRLEGWFALFAKRFAAQRGQTLTTVDLVLQEEYPHPQTQILIGTYHVNTGEFQHLRRRLTGELP